MIDAFMVALGNSINWVYACTRAEQIVKEMLAQIVYIFTLASLHSEWNLPLPRASVRYCSNNNLKSSHHATMREQVLNTMGGTSGFVGEFRAPLVQVQALAEYVRHWKGHLLQVAAQLSLVITATAYAQLRRAAFPPSLHKFALR